MKQRDRETLISIYSSSFLYSMIAMTVVAGLEIFMIVYSFLNPTLYGDYLGRYRLFIIFQLVLGISFLILKTQLAECISQERKNANVDVMTGCANRRAYITAMEALERNAEPRSYLAIDINGLKEVNDNLGHEAGDKLIIGAAKVTKGTVPFVTFLPFE